MQGQVLGMPPPEVKVFATSGRGHNADELAEMALGKLISISNDAPQPIRDQAFAYRERMRAILKHYFEMAFQSERTTIWAKLKEVNEDQLAEIIRKL